MSALDKIAFALGRRDEVPNQELARELAETRDAGGIRLLAEHLWDKNAAIQSDCLKVLYEIGYLRPELIALYSGDFLKLLGSRNNRMVWGAMIALATIAPLRADEIYPHAAEIRQKIESGTVITSVWGNKTLAALAAKDERYRQELMPYLLQKLQTSRPVDFAQTAETLEQAVGEAQRAEYSRILQARLGELSSSGAARVKRLIKRAAG